MVDVTQTQQVNGGSILMFEPSGTLTTGDVDSDAVPDHVDATAGHNL